ncbi:MAG: hypothetical protein SFW65_10075, partial [Alphaproteobacteria bacterium]|nr:hypothetical protein [Alphaproteobacteria bacterium]
MSRRPKGGNPAAHRKKKQQPARVAQPQDAVPKSGLRYLRQRIAKNPRVFYVATAVVLGGLAVTFGFKNRAESPYCLMATNSNFKQALYVGGFNRILPPIPVLAREIEDSLNIALEASLRIDSTVIKDKITDKVVGVIVDGKLVPAPGSKLTEADVPNNGKVKLTIDGHELTVSTTDRFTVARDLSTVTIAGYVYKAEAFRAQVLQYKSTGQTGFATL